jgi:hypothetical protein
MDQKGIARKVAIQQLQRTARVAGQLLFWTTALSGRRKTSFSILKKKRVFGITGSGRTAENFRQRSQAPPLTLRISHLKAYHLLTLSSFLTDRKEIALCPPAQDGPEFPLDKISLNRR